MKAEIAFKKYANVTYLGFITNQGEKIIMTFCNVRMKNSLLMIAEIPEDITKEVLAQCISGELDTINGKRKADESMPIIDSITFIDEEDNRYYVPNDCLSKFKEHSITLSSGRKISLSENEYQEIAEEIRREDAKTAFLDAIAEYSSRNDEFVNVEDFLKEHIDQASDGFYKKIRTRTSDYDMSAVLNIFRGAYWCVITLKNGSKKEAVLMDSQILMIENGQSVTFKTAKGEKIESEDVWFVEKDELYVMD